METIKPAGKENKHNSHSPNKLHRGNPDGSVTLLFMRIFFLSETDFRVTLLFMRKFYQSQTGSRRFSALHHVKRSILTISLSTETKGRTI